MSFSDNLSALRGELGLSQTELASSLNTSQTVISRYEKGLRQPDVDFLTKLKKLYAVNTNWILTGEGEMFLSKSGDTYHNSPHVSGGSAAFMGDKSGNLCKDVDPLTLGIFLELYEEYKENVKELRKRLSDI